MEKNKSKQSRCKFCHPFFDKGNVEGRCVIEGWEDDQIKVVSKSKCEECEKFDSRYIEYPITVKEIENKPLKDGYSLHAVGKLCEISPCSDEYKGKSYVGILLGDLPVSITTSYNEETGVLKNGVMRNPAIFVPELKKIIYGCESWWRVIEKIEDFKGISEEDINNTWYVKLLKESFSK